MTSIIEDKLLLNGKTLVLTESMRDFNFKNKHSKLLGVEPRTCERVLNLIAQNAQTHNKDYCKIPISVIDSEKIEKLKREPIWDCLRFGGVITGGFGMRELFKIKSDLPKEDLHKLNYRIRQDVSSDVDVFFFNRNKALAYWEYIGKRYGKIYDAQSSGYNMDIHTVLNFYQRENGVEYKHQLIIREDERLEKPEDLLETFDLSLAKTYFDKSWLYIHKSCIETLKTGILKAHPQDYCDQHLFSRLFKYCFLYDLKSIEFDKGINCSLQDLENYVCGNYFWEGKWYRSRQAKERFPFLSDMGKESSFWTL